MGFYGDHLEPRLVNLACGAPAIERSRAEVVPQACGTVLEIGYGAGRNLPHYVGDRIERLILLEPSATMRRLAAARLAGSALDTRVLAAGAEQVPLADASVDTILVTYTFCTVPDLDASLAEARRVLRPDGRLIFAEHGRAPDAKVRRWQHRLAPAWGRLAGGCQLTRDVPAALKEAGFSLRDLRQRYLPGAPRFVGFVSTGTASKA